VAGLARLATISRASDGSISFVASTDAPDRYGDTVDQSGWDTAAYEKNPVLLWAHSYTTPPVGKVGRLDKSGNLTARDVTFTTPEQHPFGAQVGEMVRAGFLNTVSVGFLPLEWEEVRSPEGALTGYRFTRQELLEISVVPVPANPQALVEGRAFAKALVSWADGLPQDAPAIVREYRDTLAAWLKGAEDAQRRREELADESAFAEMLAVLRSIDGRLEAVERALGASPLVRQPVAGDAAPQTVAEALRRLLSSR
jgi:HK97 family phage prohead protease